MLKCILHHRKPPILSKIPKSKTRHIIVTLHVNELDFHVVLLQVGETTAETETTAGGTITIFVSMKTLDIFHKMSGYFSVFEATKPDDFNENTPPHQPLDHHAWKLNHHSLKYSLSIYVHLSVACSPYLYRHHDYYNSNTIRDAVCGRTYLISTAT